MNLSAKQIIPFIKKNYIVVIALVAIAIVYRYRHKILSMVLPNQFGIRHAALEVAKTQIGVVETSRNGGKEVDSYLASIGLGTGYAWCMAFVFWCYREAAKKQALVNPLFKTGGVLKMWQSVDAKYKKSSPVVGSIFIMDLGKGNGHAGIVTAVNSDGTIQTIEGNSNSTGSAEGNAVVRNKRKVVGSKIVGFITV